jgi:GT2 family glycosyltransferase
MLPGRGYQRYLEQARGIEPFPVDWVQGSCILIRREVIEEIGYLDEDFFLFSEEVDYCYRAWRAGYLTYHIPHARIVHHESATTLQFVPLKLKGHYLGKMYYLAKHGFLWDLRFIRAWFVAELLVKSAIRGVGVLVGRPPDALKRLRAYLDLIGICATYQGQPAAQLVSRER